MDISPFWMGGIISWLRRLLQKDYNEEPRTNDHRNQQMIRHAKSGKGTEDWLKMLINELAKIKGDVSLTPLKILTGWGTQKMRTYGLQLNKQVFEIHIHRSGAAGRRILA